MLKRIEDVVKLENDLKGNTAEAARRVSNTWGNDVDRLDGPRGSGLAEIFNNGNIPTAFGPMDIDWFSDLSSFPRGSGGKLSRS
jgi:hypothetical protein